MKNSPGKATLTLSVSWLTLIATMLGVWVPPVSAQDGNRWYQIEVTIFSHENSNVLLEQWPVEDLALVYPVNTRPLDTLIDHLTLDDWSVLQAPGRDDSAGNDSDTEATDTLAAGPAASRSSDYRLPDPQRDAFVALPDSEHEFTQTNRALNESSAYRLLYHNAWRQPVMRADGAIPITVAGGRRFGDHHELEGTLTIRFNPSRDRVLLDTNLWLARFSARSPEQGESLQLPDNPTASRRPAAAVVNPDPLTSDSGEEQASRYYITNVFPMRDSRAMRSNEFHYLDHPAFGIVVQVFPYEPPSEAVTPFPETDLPL